MTFYDNIIVDTDVSDQRPHTCDIFIRVVMYGDLEELPGHLMLRAESARISTYQQIEL